jgi:hypothetical protein
MSDLDLVDSSDVGTYRHAAPFVPLFIGDTNPAFYVVATVLCNLPRKRGSVGFRAFQVRETPPLHIRIHAAVAVNVKKNRIIAVILCQNGRS